ncbi:MAG TPA: hypothetical protein VG076_17030 [Acidimicrobiales bacterium]|nr:hypothetical protein [Acidimicrobiales bacterium]
MARPAESDKVRRWNGVVANANDLEKFRVWVVWGLAAPPDHGAEEDADLYPPGGAATDLAIEIAAENDPEFAAADDDHRWVMLVEGDESDVDEWVQEHGGEAAGYASYLLEAGRAHEGSDDQP